MMTDQDRQVEAPLVKGGQGRTDEAVAADGDFAYFWTVLVIALVAALGVLACL